MKIIEVDLHFGACGFVIGNKTLHVGQNTYDERTGKMDDVDIKLPSCPKWMLNKNGSKMRFPKFPEDGRVFIPTYEISVKLPNLKFENVDERKMAFFEIMLKCVKRDLQGLAKCKWLCRIYRQRQTVLNSNNGCVAYMEYGVIGG